MIQNSAISEIQLPQTVFRQRCFIPAQINLIAGRNGTGKSTFAGLFRDMDSLVFAQGKSVSDYRILVFDRRYVTENIMQYDNMPGIVTVSRHNADIEQRIADIKSQQQFFEAQLTQQQAELEQLNGEKQSNLSKIQELCWKETKDLRKQFEKALGGKKTKQKLTEAILTAEPNYTDLHELTERYHAAFGEDVSLRPLFQTVQDIHALDRIAASELLSEPIISSSDSMFFRFIKKIHAVDWVQQGHTQFEQHTNGVCPYCQQALPADFDEQIASCVNEEYEQAIQNLQQLSESYRQTANQLFIPLQNNLKLLDANTDHSAYLNLLKLLKHRIKSNIEQIQIKIQSPTKTVELEPTKDILIEINANLMQMNAAINEYNRLISERKSSQQACVDQIIAYFAYLLHSALTDYKIRHMQTETMRLQKVRNTEQVKQQLREFSEQLRSLQQQIADTETAVRQINQLLAENGFQGFYLRKSQYAAYAYEVVRQDGTIAVNLSEGEQRFFAFLYYCFTVQNDTSIDKPVIAAIDDPFVGLDTDSGEIVMRLLGYLMQSCAEDIRQPRQLFIMTYYADYYNRLLQQASGFTAQTLCCMFVKNGTQSDVQLGANR